MALGAALDNCLCLLFCQKSILPTDSITIADVPIVYDVVLVQCKKNTPNLEVFPTYKVHMLFLN